MKKPVITAAVLGLMMAWSCTTVQKSATTKTLDVYGAGVIHMPVVVDLDVQQTKSTGSAMAVNATMVETAKQEAIAQILHNAKADVLVEPAYQMTTHGAQVNVVVTGFPATYHNFRSAKSEDIPLLQAGVLQRAQVAEPTKTPPPKKGNPGAAVAGTLLTIGLLTLLLVLLI